MCKSRWTFQGIVRIDMLMSQVDEYDLSFPKILFFVMLKLYLGRDEAVTVVLQVLASSNTQRKLH